MAAQESRLVIVIDAKNAEKTASALNNELQNITTSGNQADKQVGMLGTSIRALAGYMAGVVTVGAAINKMDAYTNLQNRLKLVTNSQQALNQATNDTFKIAQNSRQAWESVVQVYQRFSDNAKTLNLNMEQTAELTDTVAKSIAISGASTQAAEAALTQFGQALASGILRGEEFNSISEQAPALLKAIANGLEVNIGQLRAMAAEGQLTGDIVVKALQKSKESVDDLFSRTDMTIGQSFTLLNNEVQKFIGEAGKGSGAADLLSGSIKVLAENLGLITNAAIVVGVGYLTKAIVAKTIAVQADIAATIAQRAATAAQLQSEVALTVAATNDAKAHLALTQSTAAATQAKFGATAAAAKYKIATDAVTQAVIRQEAAEKAAYGATVNMSKASAGLLGFLGGPVGIGLTVASLAAGYLLMRDNTAKANEKLEEQGAIANKTTEELLKLEGAQRSGAKQDLAEAFKEQNAELERLDTLIGNSIAKISSKNTADAETAKILREVRTGVMDYESAFDALNKTQFASPDVIKKLRDEIDKYEEQRLIVQKNADAQKTLGVQVELSGNKAQNAAGKIDQNTDALDDNARAARAATKAHQDYLSKAQTQAFDDIYSTGLMAQGRTPSQAKAILDLQKAKGESAILTKEEIAQALRNLALTEQNTAAERSYASGISTRAKAQSNATNEAKKLAEQANRDAEKLAKEQYDLREGIAYEFANRTMQIEMDLQKKIADIQKANFSPQDTAGYIANARARAESEKEIFVAQLEYELNEFNLTEEAKLKKRYEINKLLIESNLDLSNENRDISLQLAEKQYQQELSYIELAKEQRIFAARESMLVEADAVRERYTLELKEIAKIKDAKERAAILEAKNTAYINLGVPNGGTRLNSVQGRSSGFGMSQTDTLNAEYIKQNEEMNLRYAQQQEAAQNNAMALLVIEQEYLLAKGRLNTEYDEKLVVSREIDHENQLQYYGNMLAITQSTFGQMTSLVKDSQGENSSAYKTMFAMQQAMAIASALVSTHLAAAQVMADPTALTLAQKTTYSSLILASGYANAGMIAAQTIAGFKTGGYTGSGGVSDVAGVVHGQEYVLNAAATKRVGTGTLDAINNGGTLGDGDEININVILNISNDGSSTTRVEGQAKEKELASVIANAVRAIIVKEKRQGGLLS